ncbi:MAG: DUF6265 family protein [Limisphaerales bacterium]
MNILNTTLAAFCLFFIVSVQSADKAPAFSLDPQKLAWLVGTWELKEGEKITEETWFPLKGSQMMGVSHTYDSKRTHFFEFLRVMVKKDMINYIPQPGGDAPVPFRIVHLDDKVAVWENPKHHHPQRIRYERTETGMTATISLLDGSRAKSFAFTRRAEAAK